MSMRVEFLGTAGAMPIPRPLCDCAVCTEARERGVPYARNGPSVFVHGPDVLIDTPGEIVEQLNRSSVESIAGCLYSHWHPDHTMGRHIFSLLNADFRVWPYQPLRVTPVYLPQQVAADARTYLGIWDHLRYLEEVEQVIEIRELAHGDVIDIGGVRIRPIPLAQDFVYAFLFDDGERRLLVAMDELDGWDPPDDVKNVDLAIVPKGLADVHPLTGERQIPLEHPVLAEEATFDETLDIVRRLDAQRVVMTHVEESDGLSHDDLEEVAAQLDFDVTFAYDTLVIDV